MKNLTLLLFFCSGIYSLTHAQKKRNQEVIYLKNGSIIRNAKSLQHLDSLIEIQTTEGCIFRFESSDIDSITREPIHPKFRARGYFIGITTGLNIGHSPTTTNTYSRENNASIQVITGYQWNPYWTTGIGAALDIYKTGTLLPVFARAAYMPINNWITPIVSMDLGYGVYTSAFNSSPTNNQLNKGGLFIHPAVGFIARSTKRTAFVFTIGYQQQSAKRVFITETQNTSQDMILQQMSVRLGLQF